MAGCTRDQVLVRRKRTSLLMVKSAMGHVVFYFQWTQRLGETKKHIKVVSMS
jgi:hypothetical protein